MCKKGGFYDIIENIVSTNMSELEGVFKMKEKDLFEYMSAIEEADSSTLKRASERQANLAKPPGALGKLEEISIKFAGITGQVKNRIKKSVVVIFSSDNGVVEEGVTPTPQSVTAAQSVNFTRRLTGVGALARTFDTDLCVVDMGIKEPLPVGISTDEFYGYEDRIINRKIRRGTSNLAKEPAMTRAEALQAIGTGIEAAKFIKAKGFDIAGVGEMGIGNTTTSACVLSALTGASEEITVGRGGGLNDQGFMRKKEIVREKGLETKYEDVVDVLAKVGGFDICAMTGFFLGAAKNKIPVVIDGYISAVAALAAYRLEPKVKDYMFGSHISSESGYGVAMKAMDMKAMLDLDMRLGEGSGCVLAFEIIKGALGVMDYMATYDEAKIDEDYLELMVDAKF